MTHHIHQGDALDTVRALAPDSVDVVVTSPPYLGLRHYATTEQVGESDVDHYLTYVTDLAAALLTRTKRTGTMWWNVGDTFNAYNHNRGPSQSFSARHDGSHANAPRGLTDPSRRNKALLNIPARSAEAITSAGWILRSDIIWRKTNPAPQRTRDRYAATYEHVFMFVRDERRYTFNMDQVRGHQTRTPGDVWDMPTARGKTGHPATFPLQLPDRCLDASLPHDGGGVVLDPFCGSGTTGEAALRRGAEFIGVDTSAEYVSLTEQRLDNLT